MPESNPINPYRASQSGESPVATSPGKGALAASILIALFCGAIVFLGTCLGSGAIAFNYLYQTPNEDMVFASIWGGSAFLGIVTAVYVGRRWYSRAEHLVVETTPAEEEEAR